MSAERVSRIDAVLRLALEPQHLEILDESHKHAGHAGARDGRGHFSVLVVSERFAGCTRVARHRLLYRALEQEMRDAIHALAIQAFTPEEWARRS